ncbi:MAG: hypothetical protein LH468_09985, partial [Nocardioides sp.]|nr:hypothetical protein [Nocardioides sp.]
RGARGPRWGTPPPGGAGGPPTWGGGGHYWGGPPRPRRPPATQIDPDGFWFAIPRELQTEVWPTEDFELVTSHVDAPTPEDDLFAGVVDPA